MLLSETAKYALRAMSVLATLPAAERIKARDLAKATGVPPTYLSKILSKLVEARLLDAVKGHGGGFRLSRTARNIRVAEILDAVGEGLALRVCAFGWDRCGSKNPCPLHTTYSKLTQAAREWAHQHTLASLRPPSGRKLG